ncbi:hypothetical protein [Xanthobacter sediminis]|uniref:hypothetical protein n=1 Tax=Xanthobacter sediminis TaxID=3119926 RepID=UPI00372A7B27
MPDYQEVLRDLRAKKRALQEQLAEIDKAIKALENVSPSLSLQRSLFLDDQLTAPEHSAPQRVRGELAPYEVANLAREVLIESGRPMRRGELVQALESRGVPLAGKDKNKNLGTIMWRHADMFVSIERLGYWPKDRSLPGVYEPNSK